MSMLIVFGPDGTGSCLYSEAIDLSTLGALRMRRASSVEFNPSLQKWEARDTANRSLFADRSREACLRWERDHFNREENLAPTT